MNDLAQQSSAATARNSIIPSTSNTAKVRALFDHWRSLDKRLNGPEVQDEQAETVCDQLHEAVISAATIPVQTMGGLAAKALMALDYIEGEVPIAESLERDAWASLFAYDADQAIGLVFRAWTAMQSMAECHGDSTALPGVGVDVWQGQAAEFAANIPAVTAEGLAFKLVMAGLWPEGDDALSASLNADLSRLTESQKPIASEVDLAAA